MGKLLGCLPGVNITGSANFIDSMQVAQLALKHRKNKKGVQRIVAFVGSPIEATDKELEKAGKLLKKNNIAVDIVLFGEIEENNDKLEKFLDKVNSSNNSHLVIVPAGILPSDVLASSPIIHGDDGGGGGGGGAAAGGGGDGGGNFAQYGGVNPDLDPELAMALRVSMEEERARQESAPAEPAAAETPAAGTATPAPAVKEEAGMADAEEDEDDMLAKALAMSQAEGGEAMDTNDSDEALQLALQMSMQAEEPATPAPAPAPAPAPVVTPAPAPAADASAAFLDPAFVNQLLEGLPGVDPNDPKIKAAMESIKGGSDDKKDDKKDEDKK
jgi:26S proteasome regulatory subunit N10